MAGPERFGYYDASPREKPKEDKSTMAKRFIEAAKQVIKKIEEQKKSTSKKEASTAEKEKTARFSKDIASFVEEKPKIKEIRRGIESEKRPPKHIEITEQTKKKLESLTVRITPDGKTEYKEQALVFSETDFTDERSAQLAIAYLEKAELAETAKDEERSTKAAQNIRETAENLWRLSV